MSDGVLIAVGVAVLLVLLKVVSTYNSMISLRNRVDEAWSGIDVQLKRRHDLVPNLVESVKGYAAHERQVFAHVTEARADALRATGVPETRAAEGELSGALVELRAVAENYPALRASENFQELQAALAETEDEIQASRRIYNSNVQHYNTKLQTFPNSIIAAFCRFLPREFFEIDTASEREPVGVRF